MHTAAPKGTSNGKGSILLGVPLGGRDNVDNDVCNTLG